MPRLLGISKRRIEEGTVSTYMLALGSPCRSSVRETQSAQLIGSCLELFPHVSAGLTYPCCESANGFPVLWASAGQQRMQCSSRSITRPQCLGRLKLIPEICSFSVIARAYK